MHIGWDLDDVTTNLMDNLLRLYNLRYDRRAVLEDVHGWDFFTEAVHDQMRKHGYPNLEVKPESVKILQKLKDRGDRVSIITYRGPGFEKETSRWLRENIPGLYDGLYMAGGSKRSICRELKVDVLVDDSKKQVSEVAEEGIHTVMLRTPMNRDVKGTDLIHVAENFDQIFEWIEIIGLAGGNQK